MKKYYYTLIEEYKKRHNIVTHYNLNWSNLLKKLKKILEIDTCKMYVFKEDFKDIKNKLIDLKYRIETIDDNYIYVILNIQDYIKYITDFENGELYSGPYEDPELYSNEQLKIEAISHEYTIILYLNDMEKNKIENELKIKLSEKIST